MARACGAGRRRRRASRVSCMRSTSHCRSRRECGKCCGCASTGRTSPEVGMGGGLRGWPQEVAAIVDAAGLEGLRLREREARRALAPGRLPVVWAAGLVDGLEQTRGAVRSSFGVRWPSSRLEFRRRGRGWNGSTAASWRRRGRNWRSGLRRRVGWRCGRRCATRAWPACGCASCWRSRGGR